MSEERKNLRKTSRFNVSRLFNNKEAFYLGNKTVSLECWYIDSTNVLDNSILIIFSNEQKENIINNLNNKKQKIVLVDVLKRINFDLFISEYSDFDFYKIE